MQENLSFIAVYFAGVAASFTPCVYPLIPIVISFIATQATQTSYKKFLLTTVYVLGVATTYSILGMIASLTGTLFGLVQNTPWANLVVSIILLIFSLSMFGRLNINFQLPIINPTLLKGYLGGFVLGATSGLVFSPCTTPILGAILTLVATKQNLLYAGSLLFVFSLGLSTTLLFTGFFSSVVTKLPKSGKWSVVIEKIFAVVLAVLSLYYFLKATNLFLKKF